LDRGAIDQEIGDLNDDLKDAADDAAKAAVEAQLRVAYAKIEACETVLYQ
jgi:hypothetical protein